MPFGYSFASAFFVLVTQMDGCQMLVQIQSVAVGSRVHITHGELAGATGVINMISDDRLRFCLKVDGLPDGVFVAVSSDILTIEGNVTEDSVTV